MRYRKLGPDNDYVFGGSQNDFWRDVPEAVAQAVETRLLLWLGEWFLDITEGTPYLQGILGKHDQQTADIVIQDRILGSQGMLSLSDYFSNLNRETRFLSVDATITTIYGVTNVDLSTLTNY